MNRAQNNEDAERTDNKKSSNLADKNENKDIGRKMSMSAHTKNCSTFINELERCCWTVQTICRAKIGRTVIRR